MGRPGRVVPSYGLRGLLSTPPLRVLDLGCGDGTTAVPLALLGADVVGIDIAEDLVAAGNRRAAQMGLKRLTFQEGDACNLQGVGHRSFELSRCYGPTMNAFESAQKSGTAEGPHTPPPARPSRLPSYE